jgi:signal transduction histidine kinase
MRERVAELGGTLVIEPCLPHGTRITARLPAPQTAQQTIQDTAQQTIQDTAGERP